MLKMIHMSFVLLSVVSFIGRIYLSEINSPLMQQKIMAIAPHIINGILLLSGITLAFQGEWATHGWLAAKVIVLFGYVGLGIIAIKSTGTKRWQAFAGALACFVYIAMVAVTKNPLVFL
ncbi:MAG: SirB2 family protein [Methylococcaceae bacterium]